MTFEAYEIAAQAATPVELYTFYAGSERFDYTSSDVEFTYLTRIYAPAALHRESIDDTGEVTKSSLRIACAHDFAIGDLFNPYPPSDIIRLELRRVHRTDTAVEAMLIWTGRVLSCQWTGIKAELQCESLLSSMRRTGLRRLYQRNCPHILYGAACGVASAAFRHAATISTVAGTSISAAAFDALDDGYLAGGYLEWNNGTRTERRGIASHLGDTIVISHPIPEFAFGNSVFVFAGCDHSITTCDGKFSNSANYGGFPYVPRKNPFGGNSVF